MFWVGGIIGDIGENICKYERAFTCATLQERLAGLKVQPPSAYEINRFWTIMERLRSEEGGVALPVRKGEGG